MNATKKFVVLAGILLMCTGLLTAQQSTAKIFGVVQLEDGSMVPGVSVEATSPKLVGKTTSVTDENGVFRLVNLTPGIYKVVFSLQGFQTVVRDNIQLSLEQTLNLKIEMKLGNIEEAVTITGQVAQIDVKSTAKSMTLNKEVFQALPKGRNFESLVTAIPGVSNEKMLLGGTSIDGASGLENMYYVDGADTTNIIKGYSGQKVSFDFVDEVQVKASGYAAEFGGSLGGVISVVTRSGGDQFHGDVIGYFSGSALRGDERKLLRLDKNDTSKAVYYEFTDFMGNDDDYTLEGGLDLGGYILKDKLWFFGSFMPTYTNITRTVKYATTSKDWKRNEQYMNFQFKLTSQPTKNLRLSASVINNFYKYKGDLTTSQGSPTPNISFNDFGFSYPNISGNFTADLTLGNSMMLSGRAGYFRTDITKQLVTPPAEPCFQFLTEAPGGYFNTTNIGLLDVPTEYQRESGYYNYNRANARVNKSNLAEKLTFGGDLTYFFNLGGEHSIKTGIQFTRLGEDVDDTASAPILFFAWDRNLIAYGTNYGRGKYGYYGVRGNSVTGPFGFYYKAYSTRLALYLQDSWTIANKVTFNVGVRAESEFLPSYATGDPKYENMDPIKWKLSDKISPRFGFIWDVNGDSSLKVFGSYGIFMDALKLKLGSGSYGGDKWKSTYYALDTYEWDKIGVANYFPGRPLIGEGKTINFRSSSFDSTDPNMKPMTQQEISLGLEKKLKEDLSFSVRLVNKHLLWAIEDCGILLPEGEMYYITNPGGEFIKSKYAIAREAGLIPALAPDLPKAKRDYYGINLSLDKRFSNNWMGGINYTWSKLTGNYNGLATGEEPIFNTRTGEVVARTDANVARYFDSWYVALKRDLTPANGLLPGDRTHYFKLFGSYSFPFGVTTGLVFNAMSGSPNSTSWAMPCQGYLPFGRNDLGRSPFLYFANIYVEYNIKLGKNTLNINLNVENITDTKTSMNLYNIYNQGEVAIPDAILAQGPWDINDYNPVLDPQYGMEQNFYPTPITARLGLKFSF